MVDREDSPWYPTMRLFRQAVAAGWEAVFERMAAELQARIGRGRTCPAIAVEIGPGELIDKITILEIKSRRIADPAKLANIRRQLADLAAVRDREIGSPAGLAPLVAQLKEVNESIWDAEEVLHGCERSGDFGGQYVEHARSIRRQNERRAALKRTIDERLGSSRFEEKSYGSSAR